MGKVTFNKNNLGGIVDAEYKRFRGRKKSHLYTLRSFPITSTPVYISSIYLHGK